MERSPVEKWGTGGSSRTDDYRPPGRRQWKISPIGDRLALWRPCLGPVKWKRSRKVPKREILIQFGRKLNLVLSRKGENQFPRSSTFININSLNFNRIQFNYISIDSSWRVLWKVFCVQFDQSCHFVTNRPDLSNKNRANILSLWL